MCDMWFNVGKSDVFSRTYIRGPETAVDELINYFMSLDGFSIIYI